MYKCWTCQGSDAGEAARYLEAHLNEFAAEVISVAYAVADQHYILAVYRSVDAAAPAVEEAAVTAAEQIIERAGP
ncbi:MAG TPA: hypothetical protein VFA78_04570 [Chloroflexota bacterium]|nr:hypothetical protein [Chloroflexota bacterium]